MDNSQIENTINEIRKRNGTVTAFDLDKISKLLSGGLLVTLDIDKHIKVDELKKSIEKTSELVPSFKLVIQTSICGECGFKDEPFEDKCPKCKSPYVV